MHQMSEVTMIILQVCLLHLIKDILQNFSEEPHEFRESLMLPRLIKFHPPTTRPEESANEAYLRLDCISKGVYV